VLPTLLLCSTEEDGEGDHKKDGRKMEMKENENKKKEIMLETWTEKELKQTEKK
jgi:hypothetical protein